ncbi:hypothetical protein RD792_008270 [Penstemon davidsonii]|uniref:BHLH domain-containing protein n=1 Tax=Penstemon davidsonii TaxID=160366 RepID=A0ABR0D8W6_9LAMI|nr:hypothetical protein RD792_008270 [Penstemon davidsonii]
MQPENSPENSPFHHFFAGSELTHTFPTMHSLCSSSSFNYPVMEELEFTEKKQINASENHKEAERKRRERINAHLDRLRALLLCNSKTDKASLLAKVVQRVRDLKQQTSEIMMQYQTLIIPSEADESAVVNELSINGKSVVRASLCCEDRIDLIPDLIEILKTLPLSPLKVEIATLGGRIRNVMVLACDDQENHETIDESVLLLRDSLKRLILRTSYNGAAGERSKRRRMLDHSNIS